MDASLCLALKINHPSSFNSFPPPTLQEHRSSKTTQSCTSPELKGLTKSQLIPAHSRIAVTAPQQLRCCCRCWGARAKQGKLKQFNGESCPGHLGRKERLVGSSAGRHWGKKPSLKDNNLLSWYVSSWKGTYEQALFCSTLLPGNPCCWLAPGVRRIHRLVEGTSPAVLSPLHHSNYVTGLWGHSRLTPPCDHIWTPHNLDFLSSQVLIPQTLQYKNVLNANDSFNVFTAYILLFIK